MAAKVSKTQSFTKGKYNLSHLSIFRVLVANLPFIPVFADATP